MTFTAGYLSVPYHSRTFEIDARATFWNCDFGEAAIGTSVENTNFVGSTITQPSELLHDARMGGGDAAPQCPTMKPIARLRRLRRTSRNKAQTVSDIFLIT
jgi:hypothetical protein